MIHGLKSDFFMIPGGGQVPLVEGAKSFFKEFSNLDGNWYIEYDYAPNKAPDFEFSLFPYKPPKNIYNVKDFMFDDAEYKNLSEEYSNVENTAQKAITLVGDIGYYYPAKVWISEDGNVYATHEYDEEILTFKSIIELIEWELNRHDLNYITIVK